MNFCAGKNSHADVMSKLHLSSCFQCSVQMHCSCHDKTNTQIQQFNIRVAVFLLTFQLVLNVHQRGEYIPIGSFSLTFLTFCYEFSFNSLGPKFRESSPTLIGQKAQKNATDCRKIGGGGGGGIESLHSWT